MRFWLGMHRVECMSRTAVPLFVSAVRLRKRKECPRASGPWALDSGGFSEIAKHGRWTVTPQQYAGEVRRWRDQIGGMEWAAIQDWMCEPVMIEKTGLSVEEHQRRTVESWGTLRAIAPDLPWVPVVQGYTLEEYHRCVDLYESFGTDLTDLPVVGLGSVCRRQGMGEAGEIVRSLYARGLRNLHGFGFKTLGLVGGSLQLAKYLASADSMAWSLRGRNAWKFERKRLCGTDHKGGCANCLPWALKWRERLMRRVDEVTRNGTQTLLW